MKPRIAAALITAGILLAGCSGDGDDDTTPAAAPAPNCQDPNITTVERALCGPGSGMTTAPPAATAVPTGAPPPSTPMPPGCNEPTVSPQYWFTVCGQTGPAPGEAAPMPAGPMQLGTSAETSGDTNYGTSGGTLELTPTTVVYHTGGSPKGSPHVTITVKTRNGGAVVAEPTDGTSGRGFEYITSEGEQLNTKVGLIPSGFDGNSSAIQPGTFQWAAYTWGVKDNQRGGTLQYTDGTGVVYTWTIPAQDTGPQVAEVNDGF